MSGLKSCSVEELHGLIQNNTDAVILDVRENVEYGAEYISGTQHVPLSVLSDKINEVDIKKSIYVLCASGARAQKAASQLLNKNAQSVYVVKGGISAWKENGYYVEKGGSRVWAIDRQVRGIAGFLVLIGLVLSYAVHPYFIGLSAFVACGLVFSALTNTCGMALLLTKMPWNQKKQ
ncbi:rhodanese-like domain-containing protein [bacterium]|nr:rhodanese-like domain-containing protein [bacterium]MCP5462832.1 rhodanese-like domain-containing protein [bacterium]